MRAERGVGPGCGDRLNGEVRRGGQTFMRLFLVSAQRCDMVWCGGSVL